MTPDEQREQYRKNCTYVRKGHEIFAAVDGKRADKVKTFMQSVAIDGKKVSVPAINAAKRWVRTQPQGSVFVET